MSIAKDHPTQLTLITRLGLTLLICNCGIVKTYGPDISPCAEQGGDVFCQAQDDGRPYCSKVACGDGFDVPGGNLDEAPYGCRSLLPEPQCYLPYGYEDTGTDDVGVEESGTSGGETGRESSSDDDGQLLCSADSCTDDPFAPVCGDSGQCEACTQDEQCAALSFVPGVVCDTEAGACVQCTPENQAACDGVCGEANTCVLCTSQQQCIDKDSARCDRSTGVCEAVPPNAIICVDADGVAPLDANCVETLEEALAQTEAQTAALIEVYSGTYVLDEPVSITQDKPVTIFAAEGHAPVLLGNATEPAFEIERAEVTFEGVTISSTGGANGDAHGIVVTTAGGDADGTTVILRETTITGAGGLGIVASGAQTVVDITRSRIVNNDGGGITLSDGATMSLVNSFVAQSNSDTDAINVGDEASASIVYSSLSALVPIEANARALVCSASASVVTARNSLFIAAHNGDEVECTAAQVTNSASEMFLVGDGNVELGDFQSGWFESIAGGNLLLDTPPTALLTTARWQTGDPTVDIEGDIRFIGDPTPGTADVAGADSLVPVEVMAGQ